MKGNRIKRVPEKEIETFYCKSTRHQLWPSLSFQNNVSTDVIRNQCSHNKSKPVSLDLNASKHLKTTYITAQKKSFSLRIFSVNVTKCDPPFL